MCLYVCPAAKLSTLETQVKALERERDSLSFNLVKLQEELADVRCACVCACVCVGGGGDTAHTLANKHVRAGQE